jgi:glutamyl-tRNA synthetase
MTVLDEAPGMLGFLLVDTSRFSVEPEAAAAVLTPEAEPVLRAAHDALAGVADWTRDEIERVLRQALVEDLGRKPKHAFGPVRVAVSGRRVSPPLFESLELLGREATLDRLTGALSLVPATDRS